MEESAPHNAAGDIRFGREEFGKDSWADRPTSRPREPGMNRRRGTGAFDWSASITLDRRLLDVVFSLPFLLKHEHVLLVGP